MIPSALGLGGKCPPYISLVIALSGAWSDVLTEAPEPPFLWIEGSYLFGDEGEPVLLTVGKEQAVGGVDLAKRAGVLGIRTPGVGMITFGQATVGGPDILDAGPLLQAEKPTGPIDFGERETSSPHGLSR
jgi:hypothetical protein